MQVAAVQRAQKTGQGYHHWVPIQLSVASCGLPHCRSSLLRASRLSVKRGSVLHAQRSGSVRVVRVLERPDSFCTKGLP
eukprot:14409059-Alexandrium_andersonii.AAC.1